MIQNRNLTANPILRRLTVVRYPLMALLLTCVALKVLIVNDIDEWTEQTPREVSLYILPDENTTLIYPQKLNQYSHQHLDILILVASDPGKSERRDAIRATWGKGDNQRIKIGLVFLLGRTRNLKINEQVAEESDIHGDILLENFYESYLNLTIKSLMIVKFAAQMSVRSEMVFKVDDDTFLNVPKLSELYQSSLFSNQISGMRINQTKPIRWAYRFDKVTSRWIVPKWLFPEDHFPYYISGLGYIFPTRMAKCLLKQSLNTPLIPIEDLFVTGILATKCGFSIQHVPGFHSKRINPCNSTIEIVLAHDIGAMEQQLFGDILAKKYIHNCTWKKTNEYH